MEVTGSETGQRSLLRNALERLSLAAIDPDPMPGVFHKALETCAHALGAETAEIYLLEEQEPLDEVMIPGAAAPPDTVSTPNGEPVPSRTLRGCWRFNQNGHHTAIASCGIDLARRDHPAVKIARGELDQFAGDLPAEDAEQFPSAVGPGGRSVIVSLRSAGERLGVLVLGFRAGPFMEEPLPPLDCLGAAAGVILQNALMRDQLARHLQVAEEMEARRKQFEREVILSVTDGKLNLCEPDEIRAHVGSFLAEIPLKDAPDVGRCRQVAVKVALEAGLSAERKADFELCLGEAATNCFQHAGGGVVQLYGNGRYVQFRVCDEGPGIHSFLLPRAMLLKGYSTKTSLGMGFSLMLSLCDRLFLTTSPQGGTDLLIEMGLKATSEIERVWEQLGFAAEDEAA